MQMEQIHDRKGRKKSKESTMNASTNLKIKQKNL